MASIEQVTSGTQTATLDTEHTLTTQTAAEVYVLAVNLSNMAAADTTVIRVRAKVLSGGSAAIAFEQSYSDAQVEDVIYTDPIPSAHSAAFTIEQTDGTGRSYEWSVLRVI